MMRRKEVAGLIPRRILAFQKQSIQYDQDECTFGAVKRDENFLKSIYEKKRSLSQKVPSEEPIFRPRKRAIGFSIPERPFKILAAPDVRNTIYQNILDWSQISQSKCGKIDENLAIALHDIIYIANPLSQSISMREIDFNYKRTTLDRSQKPFVTAISFDMCGEALAAGSSDSLVSIFDVRTGSRLRNLSCHSDAITAVSFCKNVCAPYLLATGSKDKSVVFHDVRQKFSMISRIES